MYGQATPHCLYNSPAYNEELFNNYIWEGGREGGMTQTVSTRLTIVSIVAESLSCQCQWRTAQR